MVWRNVTPTGGRTVALWSNLTSLNCTQNTLERMDSSLNLPALRALDLSNNNISAIQNLHFCSNLTSLNLGYNNIESLAPLRECTTNLQRLILQVDSACLRTSICTVFTLSPFCLPYILPFPRIWQAWACSCNHTSLQKRLTAMLMVMQGNAVRSMRGLQRLTSLTELDLRCNLLASYHDFHFLKGLLRLEEEILEANSALWGSSRTILPQCIY